MPVLLIADCSAARPAMAPVLPHLAELMRQTHGPTLRVRRLDLDPGPTTSRLRMAIGLGWHARDWVRRAERETDEEVVSVVEACGCGRHHLLALGRAHVPALRWSLGPKGDDRARYLAIVAAKEGAVSYVATREATRRSRPDLHVLQVKDPARIAAVFAAALQEEQGRAVDATPSA